MTDVLSQKASDWIEQPESGIGGWKMFKILLWIACLSCGNELGGFR